MGRSGRETAGEDLPHGSGFGRPEDGPDVVSGAHVVEDQNQGPQFDPSVLQLQTQTVVRRDGKTNQARSSANWPPSHEKKKNFIASRYI